MSERLNWFFYGLMAGIAITVLTFVGSYLYYNS